MHECTSYGPDNLNLRPFYNLTFVCDLDRQPIQTNVSNGTTTPHGEHLRKIILKFMHKCRSYYGQGNFNSTPFYNLTVVCDLDCQPTQKMFQMALLLLKENTCAKLF